MSVDGEVGQELLDLGSAHVAGMAFVVEQDEADDPLAVAVLSAEGIVADAQHLVNLIEQARRSGQGQLTEVDMKHFAIEEVESVAADSQGGERDVAVMRALLGLNMNFRIVRKVQTY
jgi:hypothetical protein